MSLKDVICESDKTYHMLREAVLAVLYWIILAREAVKCGNLADFLKINLFACLGS